MSKSVLATHKFEKCIINFQKRMLHFPNLIQNAFGVRVFFSCCQHSETQLGNSELKSWTYFCPHYSKVCVSEDAGRYFLSATSPLLLKTRPFYFYTTYAKRYDDVCIIFTLIVLSVCSEVFHQYSSNTKLTRCLIFLKMSIKFQ